jgi:hypothetical protein
MKMKWTKKMRHFSSKVAADGDILEANNGDTEA